MSMKNPVHPGRIVKMDCLAPLNLTVTRAAGILGGFASGAEQRHQREGGDQRRNGDPP
jgi:plasmid maintenance system antidote protein VapI